MINALNTIASWLALFLFVWIIAVIRTRGSRVQVPGPVAVARRLANQRAEQRAERAAQGEAEQREDDAAALGWVRYARHRIAELILGDAIYQVADDEPAPEQAPTGLPRAGDTIHTGPGRGSVCQVDMHRVGQREWRIF